VGRERISQVGDTLLYVILIKILHVYMREYTAIYIYFVDMCMDVNVYSYS